MSITSKNEQLIKRMVAEAGVLLTQSPADFANASGPAILVRDQRFYDRVARAANLGFGESYMEEWTELKQIDEMYFRFLKSGLQEGIGVPLSHRLAILLARVVNLQTPSRAKKDTNAHYDLGNEMFSLILGEVPLYTCGYWSHDGMTLEEANRAAFDLTCRKLELRPGMQMLDVGCGWGALLRHAAQNYGINGLGVNISAPQLDFCRASCQGLPVEFLLEDCRLLDRRKYGLQFDAVSAVAMINHIGPKNYDELFETMHAVLKDDGLFLLQGIANRKEMHANDPFLNKYIFPRGVCPNLAQLMAPVERYFTLEDFHNFTSYYPNTLTTWAANLNRNWEKISRLGFDERFRRMWELYFLSAAGVCRAREVIIFQAVFSKGRRGRVYKGAR